MRNPDQIHSQFTEQNINVSLLHPLRHRISDIRVTLVTVQTPEFSFLPVQIESIGSEHRFPEADPYLMGIDLHSSHQEFRFENV